MTEETKTLELDIRCSKDNVLVKMPKWFEKTAKVYGVEKLFRFKFDDSEDTMKALLKFVADRAAVDVRHRDFTRTEKEEILLPNGKKKVKTVAYPLYSTEQLEAMPRLIEVDVADHAPRKAAGKKKEITPQQAERSMDNWTPEQIKAFMEKAAAKLEEVG